MEQERLSFRQLMVLLWAGLLGRAAEELPGAAARAGAAGVLPLLAAGALLALAGELLRRAAAPAGGLAEGLSQSLGPWALYLYIIWGEVLLAFRLRLAAQRLFRSGNGDGGVWFFLVVLAALSAWMALGRLDALGRAAEMMFGALALTAGAILLLALFQARGLNLMSRWSWRSEEAGQMVWQASGVMSCGLFCAFLLQPEHMSGYGGRWLRWTAAGCAGLGLGELVILGCFGPELTGRLDNPFFQLAKSVGVEGAFQRGESIAAALWSFSDLILLAGILWGLRRIAGRLRPGLSPKAAVGMAALPAAVCALALFGRGTAAEEAARLLLPAGGLALGVVLPLLALLTRMLRKKP